MLNNFSELLIHEFARATNYLEAAHSNLLTPGEFLDTEVTRKNNYSEAEIQRLKKVNYTYKRTMELINIAENKISSLQELVLLFIDN